MKKYQKGFTLTELLLSIGIIAVLTTFATLNFINYKQRNDVKLEGQKLLSIIRDAQQKSISQENSKQWGMRLSNATTPGFYEVFSGASYQANNVVSHAVLTNGISFSNIISGQTKDIIFSQISGEVSTSTTIFLKGSTGGSGVYEIDVKKNGNIFGNYEENLIGYWDFEEGSGNTVYDRSSYSNNGTWSGTGTRYASGKIGNYSAIFEGVSGYINCGTASSLNTPSVVSVSFWIKGPNPNNTYAGIFNKKNSTNGWSVQVSNLGPGIYVRIDNSAGLNQTAGSVIPLDSTWHHVVFVINNGAKNYYLDGNSAYNGSYNIGDGLAAPTTYFRIGTATFIGQLDDVRLYSKALSASDVKQIYEVGI